LEEKKKRLSKELEEMGRGNISKLLFLFFFFSEDSQI